MPCWPPAPLSARASEQQAVSGLCGRSQPPSETERDRCVHWKDGDVKAEFRSHEVLLVAGSWGGTQVPAKVSSGSKASLLCLSSPHPSPPCQQDTLSVQYPDSLHITSTPSQSPAVPGKPSESCREHKRCWKKREEAWARGGWERKQGLS